MSQSFKWRKLFVSQNWSYFQNPRTITKPIYYSWYKNKFGLVNLIMEKISLEQEIETNIPGSNDTFSNTRYLRLIENHYLFLYNYNWFAKTNFFLYQEWYRSFVIIPGFWKIKINFGSHIISFIWMIETFIWFSINRRYLVFEKQRLLPEFVIISCSRIILSLIRFTKPHLIFYHELYIRFVIVPGFWKKHQFSFINNFFHLNVFTIYLIFNQLNIPCVRETTIASWNICLNFWFKKNPFHYQVC